MTLPTFRPAQWDFQCQAPTPNLKGAPHAIAQSALFESVCYVTGKTHLLLCEWNTFSRFWASLNLALILKVATQHFRSIKLSLSYCLGLLLRVREGKPSVPHCLPFFSAHPCPGPGAHHPWALCPSPLWGREATADEGQGGHQSKAHFAGSWPSAVAKEAPGQSISSCRLVTGACHIPQIPPPLSLFI